MDKFSLAELSGRTIFNDKLIKNGSSGITFTENRYDKVDIFFLQIIIYRLGFKDYSFGK